MKNDYKPGPNLLNIPKPGSVTAERKERERARKAKPIRNWITNAHRNTWRGISSSWNVVCQAVHFVHDFAIALAFTIVLLYSGYQAYTHEQRHGITQIAVLSSMSFVVFSAINAWLKLFKNYKAEAK